MGYYSKKNLTQLWNLLASGISKLVTFNFYFLQVKNQFLRNGKLPIEFKPILIQI